METTETTLHSQEAIDKFKSLVEEVDVCMFTTIGADGAIVSRPMFTSDVDADGNVWFFTNEFSEKVSDVSEDNSVDLIYAHPGRNIYLSVKGSCSLIIDRKRMEELWEPSLAEWFPKGLDDPKICLIKVATESAYFWNHSTSKMGLLVRMISSVAKGDQYRENEKGRLDLGATPPETRS